MKYTDRDPSDKKLYKYLKDFPYSNQPRKNSMFEYCSGKGYLTALPPFGYELDGINICGRKKLEQLKIIIKRNKTINKVINGI